MSDGITKLPRDLKKMIVDGMDYRDIKELCTSNRSMNEVICKNENFYKAMMMRDFGNWRYPQVPEHILALEDAKEVTIRNLDLTVYVSTYKKNRLRFTHGAFSYATMPGTGNTVRINDQDYIWYYFMWAPRDHPRINMPMKIHDKEMESIFNNEPFRYVWEHQQDVRIRIREMPKLNNVLALSIHRWNVFFLNRGLRQGSRHSIDFDNLKTKEDYINQGLFNSSLFYIDSIGDNVYGTTKRWATYLAPRTLKDLTLEYYEEKISFALSAQLLANENGNQEDPKKVYQDLLRKYEIMHQLDNFSALIDETHDFSILDDASSVLYHVILEHESPNILKSIFPVTESFWTDEMHVRMTHLYTQMQRRLDYLNLNRKRNATRAQ